MAKKYIITAEEKAEISAARKNNTNKNVEKRLRALELRSEGYTNEDVGKAVGANPKVVSRWISSYATHGLGSLLQKKREGNRRNISQAEEAEFINGFKEKASSGELVTVKEIKKAYCEKIGHKCGDGQIYRVLKRQKWRKVVPRKAHPNKASETEIEVSKKLTFE